MSLRKGERWRKCWEVKTIILFPILVMPKVIFPSVPLWESTIFRFNNPTGMFWYKSNQARMLMSPPDFCWGDLISDEIWRRKALNDSIILFKPLTAVILFLQIVALEDYIRNINESLPKIKWFDTYFPNIGKLKAQLKTPKSVWGPKDIDTIKPLHFEELNKVYSEVFGRWPIYSDEYAKLYDLALIRHTVAHHGSIIRPIDVSRFQYYQVFDNQHINPPVEFLTETIKYLQDVQNQFSNMLESTIFSTILVKIWKNNFLKYPKILKDLIKVFDYFWYIPDIQLPIIDFSKPFTEKELEKQRKINIKIYETLLLENAFKELEKRHF